MISVIVPLYNKGSKVCKTIDSVLRQKYKDFEVIVVDDGSKDDSADYVLKYTDCRIRYYYKENGGVSSARNYGIKVSSGEWLIFLDADDEIADDALLKIVQLHDCFPECKCLVGQTMWLQNGKEIKKKNKSKKKFKSHAPFFIVWINKIYPATRNMMIHRSLIDEYGGFDERMSFYEDWEFSLRMMKNGEIAYTPAYIGVYNQDGTGLSGSKHHIAKEMAYYTPELIKNASFWEKSLLYSNIEQSKVCWVHDSSAISFYENMQIKLFPFIFKLMHILRQKLSNYCII